MSCKLELPDGWEFEADPEGCGLAQALNQHLPPEARFGRRASPAACGGQRQPHTLHAPGWPHAGVARCRQPCDVGSTWRGPSDAASGASWRLLAHLGTCARHPGSGDWTRPPPVREDAGSEPDQGCRCACCRCRRWESVSMRGPWQARARTPTTCPRGCCRRRPRPSQARPCTLDPEPYNVQAAGCL